jgi:type I restriction enzyme S subunit
MTNTTAYKQTSLGLIPVDWEIKALYELVDNKRTIRYGIVQPGEYDENGRYMVRGQDYSFGWVEPQKLFRVSEKIESKYKNARLKAGDIIITIVGAGTGKVSIVPDWLDGANCTQTTARIAIEPSKGYSSFFYHFLNSDKGENLTYKNIKGGAQPGLNCGDIEYFEVPVPPLPEQQKIATILSTWDAAIDNCKTIIDNLKQRNKGLAQQLLSGKIRVKGFEKTKWIRLNADEVFVSHSQKNNAENEVLLSATQDRGMIPRDMLEGRVTMPTGETNSYKLVDKGDFVISLRSFQGGLEYSEYRGLVSPAYTVLKPIKPINDIFYKFYFKSYNFIGHLSVAVIGIRDGKNISYENFATIIIPNPPIEEQNAIEKILSKAEAELTQYQQKLQTLQYQKKGLMQQLLTGKTRVKI